MSSGQLKGDAQDIVAVVDELCTAPWLKGYRNWWPHFLFHSTAVQNAASILDHGELLSRYKATQLGLLAEDAAAPAIIAGLTDEQRDQVRLYFRPRTPTHYSNEGIRPKSKYQYGGAHMAVPVFLLFSARNVLPLKQCRFTRYRLDPGEPTGSSAKFLRSIDFRKVYHDSALPRQDREEWKQARHAEAIVSGSLSLDHLKWIVCRSAPERDTLLHLMSSSARKRWRKRVKLEGGTVVFRKRGTFVQSADLGPSQSRFEFFTQMEDPTFRGPFEVGVYFADGSWKVQWAGSNYHVGPSPLTVTLPDPRNRYTVRVEFDGNLAYANRFVKPTAPEVYG